MSQHLGNLFLLPAFRPEAPRTSHLIAISLVHKVQLDFPLSNVMVTKRGESTPSRGLPFLGVDVVRSLPVVLAGVKQAKLVDGAVRRDIIEAKLQAICKQKV